MHIYVNIGTINVIHNQYVLIQHNIMCKIYDHIQTKYFMYIYIRSSFRMRF